MSPSSRHGLLAPLAVLLLVISAGFFIASSTVHTSGIWITLCGIGTVFGSAGFSFLAGWFVVRALRD